MRFIHTADVHLGAQPDAGPLYSRQRGRELWDTFEHVLHVCEEEKTDLLLIAGDLFHRQPLVRELKELDYLFSGLTHTKVVLIAGNHDYIRTDSNYLDFRWSSNVFPLFGEKPGYIDFHGAAYCCVRPELSQQRDNQTAVRRTLPLKGAEPIEILACTRRR